MSRSLADTAIPDPQPRQASGHFLSWRTIHVTRARGPPPPKPEPQRSGKSMSASHQQIGYIDLVVVVIVIVIPVPRWQKALHQPRLWVEGTSRVQNREETHFNRGFGRRVMLLATRQQQQQEDPLRSMREVHWHGGAESNRKDTRNSPENIPTMQRRLRGSGALSKLAFSPSGARLAAMMPLAKARWQNALHQPRL